MIKALDSDESREVESAIRSAVAARADEALARRSVSGSLVYFVVAVTLALSTPYYSQHPIVISVVSAATFLLGSARILAARSILRSANAAYPRARFLLFATTYGTFSVWGLFCALTVQIYGIEWTAMILLLATAALAGGASSSLAPRKRLAYRSHVLLMAPTIVSAVALDDVRRWPLAALATLYLGFLIAQTRDNWMTFWSFCVLAERERQSRSEESMRAEAQRNTLVAAIEQSAELILITDAEGRIEYCNPSFQRVTGYHKREVLGRNPRFLKSGKHDDDFYRGLWNAIGGEGTWCGRITNRKRDGTLFEAEGTISAIRDPSGKCTGYVSAQHDVTEIVRLEVQLRQALKMETIGRLAGGVAHDFNNMLTVILGYAAMGRNSLPKEARQQLFLSEIEKAGNRSKEITQQLLGFSRRPIIDPVPSNLNDLVADLKGPLARLIGEDIELSFHPAEGLWKVVVDHSQVNQILLNLVANARDAMPRGGKLTIETDNVNIPEAYCRTIPDASPGPHVVLAVSDTGLGMDADTLSHIFEPFFTTKDLDKGTGLGLATVYGIVRQNGGFITVDSEPAKGAAFKIHFPRMASDEANGAKAQTDAILAGHGTILLVEDDELVRAMTTEALVAIGYTPLVATSPQQAIELCSAPDGEKIRLMLTDVVMPGMNGATLRDLVRGANPRIKVLFMSGYTSNVVVNQGVLNRGVHFLQKPFTIGELSKRIEETLALE